MRFEENRIDGILVAKVMDARIAADVAPQFKAHLAGYLNSGDRSIVLDLEAVSFIDSSGLGALIASLKALGTDGHLVIAGARGSVASMFKLTRMDKILRLFPTAAEAVASIS
jgi:anti-sigma B factor antagonist